MDSMKIESKFMTGVISKLVNVALRKKLGYDIDIQLNEVNTTVTDGKTHVHLDVDAEISKEELVKLLKSVGLN